MTPKNTHSETNDEPQKVVTNRGYGGFGLKDSTVRWMRDQGCSAAEEQCVLPGETYSDGSKRDEDGFRDTCFPREMSRTDPHLVAAVEANVTSDLSITEVPSGAEWVITEYDGAETVREKHRTYPSGEYEDGIANSDQEDCTDG